MLELCSGTLLLMTLLELSVDKENTLSFHFSKTVLNKNLFRSTSLCTIKTYLNHTVRTLFMALHRIEYQPELTRDNTGNWLVSAQQVLYFLNLHCRSKFLCILKLK